MIPILPEPSALLIVSFIGLLILTIGGAALIAMRYAEGSLAPIGLFFGVWVLASGLLAASGLAGRWELRPPPALILFVFGFILAIALSQHPRSRLFARSVPLALLIGFQAFRFPLELILHRAYVEGMMPVQMSYTGRNFDIVTGILALIIGLWGIRRPIALGVAVIFNLIGLTLLFNIVGIAIVSTPVIQAFGPDHLNLWVAQLPFIWLPTVFVLIAFLGHLLLMGRLTAEVREKRETKTKS